MQRIGKGLAVMLIISVSLAGCSSFSKEGRRQAAMRHQTQKIQKEHAKQLAKATKEANRPLRDPITISEPAQTITLEPLGSENAAPPGDNVAAPVVVETDGGQPAP